MEAKLNAKCLLVDSQNAYVIVESHSAYVLVDVSARVLTCSPSRGGDVSVNVFDINQPSLPTPFYSAFVSVSVFMVLSTVFHSINSPYNTLLSHSVLPVLFLPYWSFQLLSFYESLPQP